MPTSVAEGDHLVLFDGVCGFCSRLVEFIVEHDRRAVFNFASLQGAVGRTTVERFGGDPDELSSFHVLANYRTSKPQMFSRGSAALFVARELGWPWKVAVVARVLPAAVLDRVYNVIARNRYRVLGRRDECLIPRPEFRDRFVE